MRPRLARHAPGRELRRVLLPFALALGACSGGPERGPVEVDCSVLDDYELSIFQSFESDMLEWFSFGDSTPGGVATAALAQIPGERCGSQQALVLSVSGHTDWGAGFGEYNTAIIDGTGYEGISLWARAAGYGTSTGFLLTVTDANTSAMDPALVDTQGCVEPEAQLETGGYTVNEAGMPVPVGGELPGEDDCGNGFQRVVTAERQWHLHLLPFESFRQTALPNLIPEGLDPSRLIQFTINVPKDSRLELWLDDIGVYRRRNPTQPAAAGEAVP